MNHLKYEPYIDGLRAVAVISVILFHGFPEIIPGGFSGVDLFFVISGYLISKIIFSGLSSNQFNFFDFYGRRIRRIFPSLLLVLIAISFVGHFIFLPQELQAYYKHLAGAIGFISNFILWDESGYFNKLSNAKPLQHLWSLAIEEQFYLFWPLLLWALSKFKVGLISAIFGIGLLSFYLSIQEIKVDPVAAFFLTQYRAWELILGCVLAFLAGFDLKRWLNLAPFLSIIGAVLIIFGVFFYEKTYQFPGYWVLLPTFGASLIILSSVGGGGWIHKLLSRPILISIGLISYPLYLWHWPILSFMWIVEGGEPSIYMRVGGLILTFAFSIATYKFIETPFRYGPYLKAKTATLIFAMIALGCTYLIFYKNFELSTGLRSNGYVTKNPALEVDGYDLPSGINCSESSKFPFIKMNKDFFCMQSNVHKSPPSVVIIGDSHSYPMYYGFFDYFVKDRGENILLLGVPGCPSFYGLESYEYGKKEECKSITNNIIDYVLSDHNIRTVVMAIRAPLYTSGIGYGEMYDHNRVLRRSGADAAEPNHISFELALESTLALLQQSGKNVIFVFSPPELGFDPLACIRPISLIFGRSNVCGIEYERYLKRASLSKDIVLRKLQAIPMSLFIEPAESLCTPTFCPAIVDGKFLYQDDNHLSPFGAKTVIDNAKILR